MKENGRMNTDMTIINVVILICIVMCQTFEVYAYFLKGTNDVKYNRQLVGLANWIQYVARINYVLVLFLLSYSFEVLGTGAEILSVIGYAFLFSFCITVTLVYLDKFRRIIHVALRPLIYFTYRDLCHINVSFEFSYVKVNKAMVISFISSMLLGLAFVLPFIMAKLYPDYRMMATYSGQILNFAASAIIFSMLEPIMFKELDKQCFNGLVCPTASSVIVAKSLSQLLIFIMLMLTL
jgi:hypothetical protein